MGTLSGRSKVIVLGLNGTGGSVSCVRCVSQDWALKFWDSLTAGSFCTETALAPRTLNLCACPWALLKSYEGVVIIDKHQLVVINDP